MRQPLQVKTDYLNFLFDAVNERTRAIGSRVYEIELGISTRDLRILRMVGVSPGVTVGELVQRCMIEKTLFSKLTKSLVQRGLVERQIGQQDARQVQLCLTDAGVDIVLRAEPLAKELEARFLDCISEAEMKSLQRILRKIIDAEARSRDVFEFLLAQLRESKASDSPLSPLSNSPRKK